MTNSHRSPKGWIGRQLFKLPMMISCETLETFILDYLEGELPSRQKFIFETHLKLCRECRDYLEAYQRAIDLNRLAHEATPPSDVPEDLVAAIVASLESDQT